MESRVIYKNGWDYIVYEDGRVFLPKREYTYYRGNTLVHSSKPAREAKYRTKDSGYTQVGIWLQHRLVAEAFLGLPEDETWTVNHIDGNKTNNHYSNLEWLPHSENVKHWIYSDRGIGKKIHPVEVHKVDGTYVGVYISKKEAGDALGVHKSTLSDVVKGRYKQSGGYTFKQITKEEYYAKTNSNL
jgi:hypothetical protein